MSSLLRMNDFVLAVLTPYPKPKVAGSSPVTRTYSYDDLGRLTQDTLKDSSGVTATSHSYGYDLDSKLTSQNINLPGNSQSGAHSYTYDRAGRISSWTHPSLTGPTTISIGWDKAGNRTSVGAGTYSYDQRNRLTQSIEQVGGILPVTTTRNFTYTPRETLSQVTDGATTQSYTFDSLNRLTNYQDALSTVPYTYDSLDRIATRTTRSFSYPGDPSETSIIPTKAQLEGPVHRLLPRIEFSAQCAGSIRMAVMNRFTQMTVMVAAALLASCRGTPAPTPALSPASPSPSPIHAPSPSPPPAAPSPTSPFSPRYGSLAPSAGADALTRTVVKFMDARFEKAEAEQYLSANAKQQYDSEENELHLYSPTSNPHYVTFRVLSRENVDANSSEFLVRISEGTTEQKTSGSFRETLGVGPSRDYLGKYQGAVIRFARREPGCNGGYYDCGTEPAD